MDSEGAKPLLGRREKFKPDLLVQDRAPSGYGEPQSKRRKLLADGEKRGMQIDHLEAAAKPPKVRYGMHLISLHLQRGLPD